VRKTSLFSLRITTAALLALAGWALAQPAAAQGLVPGSTTTLPRAAPTAGANAKGIKDEGTKSCGNCGLTGGRVKRPDSGRPAARSNDWVITMPTKRLR
jgi:hypothetical protein